VERQIQARSKEDQLLEQQPIDYAIDMSQEEKQQTRSQTARRKRNCPLPQRQLPHRRKIHPKMTSARLLLSETSQVIRANQEQQKQAEEKKHW